MITVVISFPQKSDRLQAVPAKEAFKNLAAHIPFLNVAWTRAYPRMT
jgi:hypothetical protein